MDQLAEITPLIRAHASQLSGIGEIGLDNMPKTLGEDPDSVKQTQADVFRAQVGFYDCAVVYDVRGFKITYSLESLTVLRFFLLLIITISISFFFFFFFFFFFCRFFFSEFFLLSASPRI